MPITDAKAKNAKSREKQYKIQDTGGLYLLITSSGGKYWRFDFRFEGKRKTLALGVCCILLFFEKAWFIFPLTKDIKIMNQFIS
ncbi:MAG: Arm DNA-binding domain-containing protein [Desulfobacterales bacterium]|nr:Arm DNA-binding domain-containing protein [Desulfobacterales bacterium]